MSNLIEAQGQFVEVSPGVELHYWDVGQGTPLLFVTGWGFSADVFHQQIADLSKDYRVIALDPRSQGRSSTTAFGNEYATHAADLKAFIEALDLRDVVLIGWSAGAAETWGYVRLAGLERVKAHVDIDLSPKLVSVTEGDWVEGTLDELAEAIMTMSSRRTLRDFVKFYITEVMVQRTLAPAELDWILAQFERTPQWAALSLYAYLVQTDYRPEAKLLDENRPSLFVVAEWWAETAKPYLEKHYPNSEIAVLGGHMMFWEHPDRFNAMLRDFIGRL